MNIVQFIWHDLGDWLSGYGRPEVPSPALERFAAEGVVFDNHFCPAPQCSPSRAALMTGRYPHSNGVMGLTHRGWRYRAGERDLPAILGDAGWSTRLFGFQHERDWKTPETFGYRHADLTSTRCDEVSAKACEFFRSRAATERPFYVNVGFHEVHRVFGRKYDPAVLARVRVPGFLPDVEMVRKDFATFYENIRRADAAVGRVLDAIRDAGLDDDTLVIFTTDHGPEFPRAKMTLYDPGIKVAMIMRLSGRLPAGTRVAELTSHVDLVPTLLDAAGIAKPDNLQGRSLWPRLAGSPGAPREEIFAELTWHGGQYDPMRCIRTDRWKLIRNIIPGHPILMGGPAAQRYGLEFMNRHFSRPRPAEELYDLPADPWEQRNLAADGAHADVLADLRARLDRFLRDTRDPILDGDVPNAADSDYACYWHMRKGAVFQLALDEDFGEYPFDASDPTPP